MEQERGSFQRIHERLSAAFDANIEGPRWNELSSERRMRIALRLGFLLGAAAVLAYVCRNGSSLFTVGVVFVVYVAAATLWIRGQYQISVDAAQQGNDDLRPWTFRYRYTASALAAGLFLAGWGVAADFSEALIAGVLVAYLSAGYVLMRFRMYRGAAGLRKRIRVGKRLLVASGALILVGLVALQYHWAALAALAVGLLIAPIGPSILAEPAIRRLQEKQHSHEVGQAALLGAVVLIADIGIAMARINDEWAWVAIGAIALLFVAIVSSTQADIAAVIGAVTLMGVTSLSEDKPKALNPQPGQTRVLVALGDSYMSAEGAKRYYVEKGGKNHCHRAPTAWAAMAGQNTRLFESVALLACSGARTFNVRRTRTPPETGPQRTRRQYDEPGTQLDQVKGIQEDWGDTPFKPSLVVVSLGGNDSGFSTIGMMCLAPGDCSEKEELWLENLDEVGTALRGTYEEIAEAFPESPVLVTAYPAPIYSEQDDSCDQVALSEKDIAFIGEFVTRLNQTVKEAAEEKGFYFLDTMEEALAQQHLQLCDPENDERPGINFIGLQSVDGIAEQRFNPKNWYHNSLHPNERGHAAMLQVFEQWWDNYADGESDEPEANTATGGATGAQGSPDPPCDLVGDDQGVTVNCEDEGQKWAKGQVTADLLWRGWWGLQILAAALGAWLIGVALFGWWKPWWDERPSA